MAKENYLQRHISVLNDEITTIREQIIYSEHLPAKSLVELYEKQNRLQETVQFLYFLNEKYNKKEPVPQDKKLIIP